VFVPCYGHAMGETGVMDFGLKYAQALEFKPSELFLSVEETQPGPSLNTPR